MFSKTFAPTPPLDSACVLALEGIPLHLQEPADVSKLSLRLAKLGPFELRQKSHAPGNGCRRVASSCQRSPKPIAHFNEVARLTGSWR